MEVLTGHVACRAFRPAWWQSRAFPHDRGAGEAGYLVVRLGVDAVGLQLVQRRNAVIWSRDLPTMRRTATSS